MIGLSSLEVYNSIFKITEENNNIELYAEAYDEFSIAELKEGLEEILAFSDITPKHLQRELIRQQSKTQRFLIKSNFLVILILQKYVIVFKTDLFISL